MAQQQVVINFPSSPGQGYQPGAFSPALRVVFVPWSDGSSGAPRMGSTLTVGAILIDAGGEPVYRKMRGVGSGRAAALGDLLFQAKQSGDAAAFQAASELQAAGLDAVAHAEWRDWPYGVKPRAAASH